MKRQASCPVSKKKEASVGRVREGFSVPNEAVGGDGHVGVEADVPEWVAQPHDIHVLQTKYSN